MNSILKPCPSCGGEAMFWELGVECSNDDCSVFGPTYDKNGSQWNAMPRKIKMARGLPTENGMHLWAKAPFGEMISTYVFMYSTGPKVAHNGDLVDCASIGGYWAKVEKHHFEFEG